MKLLHGQQCQEVHVRLPMPMYRALKDSAQLTDTTLSELIREFLKLGLDGDDTQEEQQLAISHQVRQVR